MTRDYGRYLAVAIDSILLQDMRDWEMVIADDASSDDTPSIVLPYLSDPRITYVQHEKALGQAGNWKFCLAWGSAPAVAVLHADDSYVQGAFRWAVETLETRPEVDFAFGNCVRIRHSQDAAGVHRILERVGWSEPDGELGGPEAFVYIMRKNHALPSTSFIRRTVLARCGYPDPRLKMMVDVEMFRRLAIASRRMAWTNTTVTRYLEHFGSTTTDSMQDGTLVRELAQFPEIFSQNLKAAGIQKAIPHEIMRREMQNCRAVTGSQLFRMGVSEAMNGRYVSSLKLVLKGFSLAPSQLLKLGVLLDFILVASNQKNLLKAVHFKRWNGIIGDEKASLIPQSEYEGAS